MARKKKNKMPSKKTDRKSNIGKVYRGRTKYIDKDTKPERNYVVVVDEGKRVSVAKLKSIKIFDENGLYDSYSLTKELISIWSITK